MRVLLIEDSPSLRRSLSAALGRAGWVVECSADGASGLEAASTCLPDIVILDLMLPRMDGFAVLSRLRQTGCQLPILVLSARDAVDDRVKALSDGADDYLVKPFSMAELEARLLCLMRRRSGRATSTIELGRMVIDPLRRTVRIDGKMTELPRREFALLELLAGRAGEVVPREEITRCLWNDGEEVSANAVEAAVSALRRAIDPPGQASVIRNRRGLGWTLCPP